MLKTLTCLLVIPLLTAATFGQTFEQSLAKLRGIRILEATRDDVRRVLSDHITQEDNDYEQGYESSVADVTVYYSNGTCSEDQDDDHFSSVWKTKDWTVVRIDIEPTSDYEITARTGGIDLSKFAKEQRYAGDPEALIYHDKTAGLAIETFEGHLQKIILYPGGASTAKLCDESTATKDFYSRKSWYSKPLEKRFACELINQPANVNDVILSSTEIAATTTRTIAVKTLATDPENDVLTFSYVVSAGVIIGRGENVVWDLSNAKPGEYTIVIGVDDGAGIIGRTVTRTVTVK